MAIISVQSRSSTSRATSIGVISAASPTTPSVLNRLEPTTLPSTRSCSPRRRALIEEASSGKEVPTATTVNPMIRSLTPKLWAMDTAPHTSRRELTTSSNKPRRPEQSGTQRHRMGGDILFGIRSHRILGCFQGLPYAEPDEGHEDQQQQSSFEPAQHAAQQQQGRQQGHAPQDGNSRRIMLECTASGEINATSPRISDVDDVRAIGIAQRQPGIALRRRDDRDHKLGRRGAKTDHQHPDQQGRQPEVG